MRISVVSTNNSRHYPIWWLYFGWTVFYTSFSVLQTSLNEVANHLGKYYKLSYPIIKDVLLFLPQTIHITCFVLFIGKISLLIPMLKNCWYFDSFAARHLNTPAFADQQNDTFISFVRTLDTVWGTCHWLMRIDDKRDSRELALEAQFDKNDEDKTRELTII